MAFDDDPEEILEDTVTQPKPPPVEASHMAILKAEGSFLLGCVAAILRVFDAIIRLMPSHLEGF